LKSIGYCKPQKKVIKCKRALELNTPAALRVNGINGNFTRPISLASTATLRIAAIAILMFRKFGFLLVFSIGKYILIKNGTDKPMSRYEWEKLMESSYITMPKWYYNISECDRRYDEVRKTMNKSV